MPHSITLRRRWLIVVGSLAVAPQLAFGQFTFKTTPVLGFEDVSGGGGAAFLFRGPRYSALLDVRGLTLARSLRPPRDASDPKAPRVPAEAESVRVLFGDGPALSVVGRSLQPFGVRYITADAPSRAPASVFREVVLNLRPEVRLLFRFDSEGRLSFDIEAENVESLGAFAMHVEGDGLMAPHASGPLASVPTGGGRLSFELGASWATALDGSRTDLRCTWAVDGDRIGLRLLDAPPKNCGKVVVDPAIDWSIVFSQIGPGFVFPGFTPYLAAGTLSSTAPAPDGTIFSALVIDSTFQGGGPIAGTYGGGQSEIAIFHLNLSGAILGAAYLGGIDDDIVTAVTVAPNGDLLVCGYTWSTNFPHSATFGSTGFQDAFVVRLTSGLAFLSGVVLGGPADDHAVDLCVEASGSIAVCGGSFGPFPTTLGSWAPVSPSGGGGFVARIDGNLSTLLASTYCINPAGTGVGGTMANSIAVVPGGLLAVVGSASPASGIVTSPNARVPSAAITGASLRAFFAIFGPNLTAPTECTFLGNEFEVARHVRVNPAGDLVIIGSADITSPIPFTGGTACHAPPGYNTRHFIMRTGTSASAVPAFVVPVGHIYLFDLEVGPAGDIWVCGTCSLSFPPVTPENMIDGRLDRTYLSVSTLAPDGWVGKLSADGSTWIYATLVGGNAGDSITEVVLPVAGNPIILGLTTSSPWSSGPTVVVSFIAQLGLQPVPIANYGIGVNQPCLSGISAGSIGLGAYPTLDANSYAYPGNGAFAVQTNVVAAGVGGLSSVLCVSTAPAACGQTVGSATIWVDVYAPGTFFIPFVLPASGAPPFIFPLPIPSNAALTGLQFFLEMAFACPTTGGVALTDALVVTVQ